MKKNDYLNYEYIDVKLTKDKFPIAYNAKLEEMVENGMSVEEAEKFIDSTTFEMELYYEKNQGLFMVESESVESGVALHSPYSQELLED